MPRLADAALALLLAAVAAPAPASADTVIASIPRATSISARNGLVAWSHYDPVRRAYVLAADFAGAARSMPVAPRSVPFDIDLGPDATGATVAVYSRCSTEPRRTLDGGLPEWRSARGCNLYRFDFATRLETRLAETGAPGASEYLPSIWGSAVAFARAQDSGRRSRAAPRLVLTRLGPGGSESELPGRPGGPTRAPGPTGLDLYRELLAFTWEASGGSRRDRSLVVLDEVGGGQRIVDRVTRKARSASRFLSPSFARGALYYGQVGYGAEPRPRSNRFHRFSPATGRAASARAPKYLAWMAQDGSRTFYSREIRVRDAEESCLSSPPKPTDTCRVARRDRTAFR